VLCLLSPRGTRANEGGTRYPLKNASSCRHSIASSAAVSNDGGMFKPSAFATLRARAMGGSRY
jgi:hypothetical protein